MIRLDFQAVLLDPIRADSSVKLPKDKQIIFLSLTEMLYKSIHTDNRS